MTTVCDIPLSRAREYLHGMSGSASVDNVSDVRRIQFARFVRRAVDRAKETQRWTIERIAKEAKIGPATIYRWMDGEWKKSPEANAVLRFCAALGIPQEIPFGILWPEDDKVRQADTEPLSASPAIEVIMRKLADPNVSDVEKYHINETLESLASRRSPRP
jgi:transcriptional regulator with XRE-family HTH domain